MTHLHLRRVSSLQTASCTFCWLDDPNFERSCLSDVTQSSRTEANPVASPQPVVGIHFELVIREGLIKKKIPSCFLNFLSELQIHAGGSRARARMHAHKYTTMSPGPAKFTQLLFQELKKSLTGCKKTGSVERRKSGQQLLNLPWMCCQ